MASACPYIGLSPFREEDHESFFGRDSLTASIVQRLQNERLLVLVGPSGSGKTSVLNAGVLPQLKAGEGLSSREWSYFPPFSPGSEPLKSLASLFTEDVDQTAEKLLQQPVYLRELLNDPRYGDKPSVLVIDQFEELFTLCKDDQRREAFLTALQSLRDSPIKHRVVLSMRSDHVNQLIRRPALNDLFSDAEVRLYPLREAELHEVIEKPAQTIGLKFEPGVVDQLLREIYGDPVGLPLLQFALLQLWADREGDTIRWAAMNRLKSCREALVQKAEEFYGCLTDDEKNITRRIMLKMVRLSDTWEAASESVRLEDLYQPGEDREPVNLVLKKLLAANLARISNIACQSGAIVAANMPTELSPDYQFELAHQSLARYWPEITKWFNNLRESLVTKRRLELQAANWSILGHKESGLLDKYQLHEAENWLVSAEANEVGYDADLPNLVASSRKAIDHESLVRRVRLASMIGLLVFGIALLIGVFLYGEHVRLKEATSLRLALQADSIKSKRLDLALLLNHEAFRKDRSNVEARNSLMRALMYSPKLSAFLTNAGERTEQMVFSGDGKQLVALDEGDRKVKTWDAFDHISHSDASLPEGRKSTGQKLPLLSPDGRNVLYLSQDGSLVNWDVEKKQQVTIYSASKEFHQAPSLISYSNDGSKLVWLANVPPNRDSKNAKECQLTVWDIRNQREIVSLPSDRLTYIAISSNNETLAAKTDRGAIILSRMSDLKPVGKPLKLGQFLFSPDFFDESTAEFEGKGNHEVVFSEDGMTLAAKYSDQEIAVWRVSDQRRLGLFQRGKVNSKTFDQRQSTSSSSSEAPAREDQNYVIINTFILDRPGELLVVGYGDGSVVFWNVEDGRNTEYAGKHGSAVADLAFTRDGKKLVSVAKDGGPLILWERSDAEGSGLVRPVRDLLSGLNRSISRVTFDPTGRLVAGLSSEGTIVLWDMEQRLLGEELKIPVLGEPRAYNDDGFLFSLDHENNIVVSDVNRKSQVERFSLRPSWLESQSFLTLINDIYFSRKANVVAAHYNDDSIGIWDARTGTFIRSLSFETNEPAGSHRARILGIALDADGQKIAVATDDSKNRKIVIWTGAGSSNVTVDYPRMRSPNLALSPDGSKLAAVDALGVISIWDAATGSEIRSGINGGSGSYHLEFTNDGKSLVSLSSESLSLWSASQPAGDQAGDKVLVKYPNILDFTLNPQTDSLAATSIDGSIVFVDLTNGDEQFRFPHEEIEAMGGGGQLTKILYARNGKSLITGHYNGFASSVSTVLLDMGPWTERACRVANHSLGSDELQIYKVFADEAWKFWKGSEASYSTACRAIPEEP